VPNFFGDEYCVGRRHPPRTSQQIGASIGTALLNTVAAGATAGYRAAHGAGDVAVRAAALVAGFHNGFIVGALVVAAAAIPIALMMNTPRPADGPSAPRASMQNQPRPLLFSPSEGILAALQANSTARTLHSVSSGLAC
jgi:hypothetical protein